jgi:hypothetical protein
MSKKELFFWIIVMILWSAFWFWMDLKFLRFKIWLIQ